MNKPYNAVQVEQNVTTDKICKEKGFSNGEMLQKVNGVNLIISYISGLDFRKE